MTVHTDNLARPRTQLQEKYKMKLDKQLIEHIDTNDLKCYVCIKYHVMTKTFAIGTRTRYRKQLVKFLTEVACVEDIPEPTFHQDINVRFTIENFTNNQYDAMIEYASHIPTVKITRIHSLARLM